MHKPHNSPKEWEVREPIPPKEGKAKEVNKESENLEEEYSGKIDNLDKLSFHMIEKERSIVTKTLLFTLCSILIVVVACGVIKGDWTPLEKMSNLVNLIFGSLLSYYYRQGR